jgi:DNA-binding NtrC family response regulator
MKVLVVDDQKSLRAMLRSMLERLPGLEVVEAATLAEALSAIDGSLSLAFVDLRLSADPRDRSGLDVLKALRARSAARAVVVTGYHDLVDVRAAMRGGAFDYLLKEQLDEGQVERLVEDVRSRRALEREVATLRARGPAAPALIGASAAMVDLKARLARVAVSSRPVLVQGPSGSGKELVAAAVHALGAAPTEPFVGLNMAALPEALLESTLFGHARGAFTGAETARPGLLAAAGRGTIFLDEIAELPLAGQAKLLRVLERGSYRPVGSDEERFFEGRVVAATHQDLEALVASGRFREDLFHRLAVLRLTVPALVERLEDLDELVAHFATAEAPSLEFTADALAALRARPWPGNVRQLRNVIDQVRVFVDARPVSAQHLEPFLAPAPPSALTALVRQVLAMPLDGDRLAALEAELIRAAMHATGGNQSAAARLLGVHRKRLERRLGALDELDQSAG